VNIFYASSNRRFSIFLLLTTLAIVINLSPVPFFTGAQFLFGNVIAVAVTFVFGWRFGLACSLVSASMTWFVWQHFLMVLPFAGEIIAVAIARKNDRHAVMWGLLYWVTIGAAIVAAEYYWLSPYLDIVKQAIVVKYVVNGALNIILGYLLALVLRRFVASAWRVQMNFSRFISVIILFTLTIGIFANTYFWLVNYQQVKLKQFEKDLLTDSKNIATELEQFIDSHLTALESVAAVHAQSAEHLNWEITLNNTANLYPNILTMLVTESSGTITATYPANFLKKVGNSFPSVSDRPYFNIPQQSGQPFVSDVFEGRGFGSDPIVALSVPLMINGKFTGIIEASLNLDKLSQIDSKHVHETATTLIFDRNNNVIYASESLPYAFLQNLVNLPIQKHIVAPKEYYFVDFADNYHIAKYWKNDKLGWTVVSFIPRELYESDISVHVLSSLVFLCVFLLICYVVVVQIAKHLSRPITELNMQLLEVNNSRSFENLDLHLEPSFLTEINSIHPIINRFSKELRETLASLNFANRDLEEFNHNLESRVQQQTKDLEQALIDANAASEAKSEFLATMSHEIRTPMNGVLGMLELLEQSEVNSEAHHRVQVAKSSAKSLLNLINDVLDFSKIEAGKLEFEQTEFSLMELVSEIIESHSLTAQNRKLQLISDCTEIEQDWIYGDPHRIRQVLTNIIGNALKFTQQGQVKLVARNSSLMSIKSKTPLINVEFEISDTGIGISEEQQQKLFNPFMQADSSTTRRFGGTGLGLSIANRLCELMKGEIKLHSELGKGSTFEIKIQSGFVDKPSQFKVNLRDTFARVVCLTKEENEACLLPQLRHWNANLIKVHSTEQLTELYPRLQKANTTGQPILLLVDTWFFDETRWQCEQFIADNHQVVLLSAIDESLSIKSEAAVSAICNYAITPMNLHRAIFAFLEEKAPELKPKKQRKSRISILVVDDNDINMEVTTHMLKNMGMNSDCAANGKLAIDKLKASPDRFDLILMDCQMPEMDGFTATRKIRSGEGGDDYRGIPIIALTANAMASDREKCTEAGMNDHLSKPIEFAVLQNKLYSFMEIT